MSKSFAAPPGALPAGDSAQETSGLLAERRLWLMVFGFGLAVWLLTATIAALTNAPNLVPNVFVLGSFLVPVVAVLFVLSRPVASGLTATALILGFLGGGTIGTAFSALTEVYFLPAAAGTFVGVGLLEESSKALVVAAVALLIANRRPRDGMVLGATVGAGFAAFESTGYAFQTFMKHSDDHAILDVMSTEVGRAVLAPFGHLTWTALVGGALFAAWKSERFGPIAPLLWTFIGVVALHAAWDATYGWSIVIAQGVEGDGWFIGWPHTRAWIGAPSSSELVVSNVVYVLFVGLNALIGTVWIIRRWRRYGVTDR
jgi:RsiW-degrading membrane proteinase PrsW (M82 family)